VPAQTADTIFELRDYTLRPGQREALIDLFEREFIESQEAVGAHILGTFRDLDAPDHFVWIRSFADMAARLGALSAFYDGPVWRAHREAANATMIDADNVHLLHAVGAAPRTAEHRASFGSTDESGAMIVADVFPSLGSETEFAALVRGDRRIIGAFASERSENDFPRLPVRSEIVHVALRRFAQVQAPSPIAGAPAPLRTMRLSPTARSLLR
jgi:quinol monooxygenase YgiN